MRRLRQSPRDRFTGTYKPRDYMRRSLDIFSVFFLVRFTKRPLRFFGMIGAVTFGLGALITAWLVIDRAGVGADGRVTLVNDSQGSVDLLADLVAWFPTGSSFSALPGARLLDTRATTLAATRA